MPIYGPGGGNPTTGEEAKPMYTVTISNDLAQENMKKAADAKMKKRWDYKSSDSDTDDDEKPSTKERTSTWQASQYDKETGKSSSSATTGGSGMNPRSGLGNFSPLDNAALTTGYGSHGFSHTDSKQSRARSLRSNRSAEDRKQGIEAVGDELQSGTTRGRRKVGATVASHISPLPGPPPGMEVRYPQQSPATLGSQSQRPPLPLSPPFPGPQAQYLPQPPPPSGSLSPQPDEDEKLQ